MPRSPPEKSARSASMPIWVGRDRKSTRLNSSHQIISYAVFCLKKKRVPDPSAQLIPPVRPADLDQTLAAHRAVVAGVLVHARLKLAVFRPDPTRPPKARTCPE